MAYCFVCKKDIDKYHMYTRQETRVVKGIKVSVPITYALCDKCNNPVDLHDVSVNNEKVVFDAYHKVLHGGKQ